VRGQITPALGKLSLSKIESIHVDEFLSRALTSGRRDGKGGLSPQTVNHLYGFLTTALKRAVDLGLIARNPCDRVKPPKVPRGERPVLTEAETLRLLETASSTTSFLPVLLAVTTGLRRSELFGLKWEDVDLERGTLMVRRTLQQTNAGLELSTEMKTPKSRRQVHLPEMTLAALRRHKAEQAAHRLRVGPER
jgi:integrase